MSHYTESANLIASLPEKCGDMIDRIADHCIEAIDCGGRILTMGNGGSAAQALHFAAELTVRLRASFKREPIPALCLNADVATITACANDYGYDQVFRRQLEAHGGFYDVAFFLSTSGNSENVLSAWSADAFEGSRYAITGDFDSWMWEDEPQSVLRIPSTDTARIQEATLVIIHELCRKIEEGLYAR